MNRRLRKKKKFKEYQELYIKISGNFKEKMIDDEENMFIDEVIDMCEDNHTVCCGTISGVNNNWDFSIEVLPSNIEFLSKIYSYFKHKNKLCNVEINGFFDCNYFDEGKRYHEMSEVI